jgi:hypothetical protein
MKLKGLLLRIQMNEQRVIRTGNSSSAFYADQSNYCSAEKGDNDAVHALATQFVSSAKCGRVKTGIGVRKCALASESVLTTGQNRNRMDACANHKQVSQPSLG